MRSLGRYYAHLLFCFGWFPWWHLSHLTVTRWAPPFKAWELFFLALAPFAFTQSGSCQWWCTATGSIMGPIWRPSDTCWAHLTTASRPEGSLRLPSYIPLSLLEAFPKVSAWGPFSLRATIWVRMDRSDRHQWAGPWIHYLRDLLKANGYSGIPAKPTLAPVQAWEWFPDWLCHLPFLTGWGRKGKTSHQRLCVSKKPWNTPIGFEKRPIQTPAHKCL